VLAVAISRHFESREALSRSTTLFTHHYYHNINYHVIRMGPGRNNNNVLRHTATNTVAGTCREH